LSFTQERYGTIVDPLGSLNNIMKLTRQRRVSPDQNTSRNTSGNTQGRNFTAALTVGRPFQDYIHYNHTREFTLERNLSAAINVGRVLLHLAV
jgi:hypothetical protein